MSSPSSLLQRRRKLGQSKFCSAPAAIQSAENDMKQVPLDLEIKCKSTPLAHGRSIECSAVIREAYDVHEPVGRGSFSVVYSAVRKFDGNRVALKIARTADEEHTAMAQEEFKVLQRLSHCNIARALDYFTTEDGQAVLALKFFAGSRLIEALRHEQGRFSETTSQVLFVQLVRALDHLHVSRILHRDVKPENVLISDDLRDLQLIDFNIARYLADGASLTPHSSPAYASPEMKTGGAFSEASDVWGAGLCLGMMLSGQCPYFDAISGEVFTKDSKMTSTSQACKQILGQCLAVDPSARPAARALLQVPWALYGSATFLKGRRNTCTSCEEFSPCPTNEEDADLELVQACRAVGA